MPSRSHSWPPIWTINYGAVEHNLIEDIYAMHVCVQGRECKHTVSCVVENLFNLFNLNLSWIE